MKTQHLKYATTEVPRYTSYPTAAQFGDLSTQTYRDWLGALKRDEPISLYVHVPFCHEMCWYCGCHTTIVSGYDRVGTYFKTLMREVELLGEAIGHKPRVSHLHFGGGTPTILSPEHFGKFVAQIAEHFEFLSDADLAVEMDPRTLSAEMVGALADAGINRASLGVQDFSPHVQANIHRIQPFYIVDRSVKWLRAAGIKAINFDLMYGLPYQKLSDVERTVTRALSLEPDRIAMFGYAHVPWFKKHMRVIKEESLPDTLERYAEAQLAADLMREHGYEEIGFDHYAKPDDAMSIAARDGSLKRNFQGYTVDEADTMLGLGASSIGQMQNGYVQNAPNLKEWREIVESGQLTVRRGLLINDDDRFRRAAIEKVMTDLALDMEGHCKEYGQPVNALDDALDKLKGLEKDGLIELDGRKVKVIEPQGRRFLRSIAASFDQYWIPSKSKHSKAV
ncbi:MAG: oxygen-independent coproporphyrinogen III oxidase [Hyphomicrobiaceae bacterium]|nr:oxygen-independent coproporphyrinogen III oxidase [Hyphomicrobiaceae bacterium]